MKIRMTVISSDMAARVQSEVGMLRHAVDAGDMDGVDAVTARLLLLTNGCRSVDLSEAYWRSYVNDIRSQNPALESSYLLPGEVCVSLFPTITTSEQVLELPIDDDTMEEEFDV